MHNINEKLSIVFDSFIMPPGGYRNEVEFHIDQYGNPYTVNVARRNPGFAILVPGIRLHTDHNRAFQFGFAGIVSKGELLPFPFPMVQWFRKL
jgi:hypothetical protein